MIHAEAAHQARRLVGKDVAKYIGGDGDIIIGRVHQHFHGEGIHHAGLKGDIGILLRHLPARLQKQGTAQLEYGVLWMAVTFFFPSRWRPVQSRSWLHGGIAPGDNPQGNRQVRRRHTVAGAAGPVAIRLETLVVLLDNHQIRLAVEAVLPLPGPWPDGYCSLGQTGGGGWGGD